MTRLLAIFLALTLGITLLGCEAENPPKAMPQSAATPSKSNLIDINSANKDELMTLRGIGEARAKIIIKERPYARKDALVQMKIVPQSVYDGIKDQIIAKQK